MIAGQAGVEVIDRVQHAGERLLAVAELGVQRKPGPDRPWTGALAIEHELLAAAALVADGEGLLARLDAIAPPDGLDTGGAFARAFVLGSASEDALADAAAHTLRAARPEARSACADALALAPSPAIGPAVARLLDGAAPALAVTALGVLRFRRQAPYGAVVPLLAHPDVAVAAAAARCLGTVPWRRAAAAVLRALWTKVRSGSPGRPLKLRFGCPYTPDATLDELEAEAVSSTRADAALELAIVSRGASLVETGDWVARQRTLLAAARNAVGDLAYPAGAFVGSRLAEP